MILGPTKIYQCPTCEKLFQKNSILSGNTFGAKLYSDGKSKASMLPEFPGLIKCKKCGTKFWLNKLEPIGSYEWMDRNNTRPEWKEAAEAKFPKIKTYFEALDEGLGETPEEELYIRQHIWWAYNDRHRNSKNMFEDEEDKSKWRENCMSLISLLDQSDLNQKIMVAELNRNLGHFDQCVEIIQSIDNDQLEWLKQKFMQAIMEKNRWVIELD